MRSAKNIALYGVTLALIFVTMTIDRAISVFTPLSMAVVTISVTLAVCLIQNRLLMGVSSGVMFGFASWVTSAFFPRFMDFLSPLISLLPRVFVGIVCFSVYRLMLLLLGRMSRPVVRQYVALTVATVFGVVTNTVCVLGARELFGFSDAGLATAIKAILVTNFVPEVLVASILVPPTVLGVRKGLSLNIDQPPKNTQSDGNDTVTKTELVKK